MVEINIQTYEVDEAWYRRILLDNIGDLKFQLKTSHKPFASQSDKDWPGVLATLSESFSLLACTVETDSSAFCAGLLFRGPNSITDNYVISLMISKIQTDIEVYAESMAQASEVAQRIKELPLYGDSFKENTTKFIFWQADPEEGSSLFKNDLSCPSLQEIKNNYEPGIFSQVEALINLESPYDHGKIVLWHGPAGNGKTHLIRALAKHLADIHGIVPEVIVDPESVFSEPKYLTSLLTTGARKVNNWTESGEAKFRFIIMEDCAELFSVNCRNTQGFSRLLNTADGLLGQGQKLMFLFTANESIEEVDPAILRPGRCLQNLEISNWSKVDAAAWVTMMTGNRAGEIIPLLKEKNSLAEMYALVNNRNIASDQRGQFGF